MNIYLIRHGRQNSRLCNVDVELSKEGREQADLLGKRLEKYDIEAVYSSRLSGLRKRQILLIPILTSRELLMRDGRKLILVE